MYRRQSLRRRQFLHLAAGAVALPAVSPRMGASPSTRPITMVVPYPPGGATDVIGRMLAERMRLAWSTRHRGERDWRGRHHRHWPGRTHPTVAALGGPKRLTRVDRCCRSRFDLLNDFEPVAQHQLVRTCSPQEDDAGK